MHKHRKQTPPSGNFIRPIDASAGPVTLAAAIAAAKGVDTLIRAISAGLVVFDAGDALLIHRPSFDIICETRGIENPFTRASSFEAVP
jgi:hypothetical protein